MKILALTTALLLSACSNTVPQIGSLGRGRSGDQPSLAPQSINYANTNVSGAKEVTTAGMYKIKAMVHSGTESQHKVSADGYKLEIRSLSF